MTQNESDGAIEVWKDHVDEMGLTVNEDVDVPIRKVPSHNGAVKPDTLYAEARLRKVAQMRVEGYSQEEIAKACGIGVETLKKDIKKIKTRYAALTKADWRKVLEGELIRLDSDEINLRNMLNFEQDVDRALRIYDRILKTGEARRKVLAIEDAAKLARGVPTEQEIRVKLEFDGGGRVIQLDADDVEEIEEAEIEEQALDMSPEVEIDI